MAVGSRWAVAVLAVGLVSGVVSCTGEEPSDLPSPLPVESGSPAPSPGGSLSPEDARAAEEILAAFDEYMAAYVELSMAGAPGGSEDTLARLESVPVIGPAAFHLMDEVLTPSYQAGRATAGDITWTAHVVEIDWSYSPPLDPEQTFPFAILNVCFDESNWTTVVVETGEVAMGPRGRYRSTVTARWVEPEADSVILEAGWYINNREDGTQPC